MKDLIDPLELTKNDYVPPKSQKEPQTAANINESVNICPVCGQKMEKIKARGHQSYVCFKHRIVLPEVNRV